MKLVVVIFIGLGGAVIAGCGGSETESVEPETVFDPLVETLDKAKATQDLEQDRKRRIDEQLEQN